jgi:hypothetical protein
VRDTPGLPVVRPQRHRVKARLQADKVPNHSVFRCGHVAKSARHTTPTSSVGTTTRAVAVNPRTLRLRTCSDGWLDMNGDVVAGVTSRVEIWP